MVVVESYDAFYDLFSDILMPYYLGLLLIYSIKIEKQQQNSH